MQLPTSPVDEPRDPRTVAVDVFHAVSRSMRGADDVVGLAVVALLAGGHLLVEGVPGHRQDAARQVAGQRDRRTFRAGPVHARPAARRRHRHLGVQPGDRRVGVPRRAGVRERAARRRGEPRVAPHPGRAARTDGGAPGHDRRRDAPAARAVLPRRHREPVRARGHVPAARQSARPVRDGVHDRPSRPRSRARDPERWRRRRSARRHRAVTTPAELAVGRWPRSATCTARTRSSTTCSTSPTRPATIPGVALGASPRASLSLLHAAQAHATVTGRDFVSPDDVKAVASASLAHRIVLASGVDVAAGARVITEIVERVAAPHG